MDKVNMSLDQIIKLQKKEKQQMQAKLSRAKNVNKGQKNIGQKKRTTNITGKANYFPYDTSFKQFRGRVAGKKLGTTAKTNRVSPLNRQKQGQQQKGKQMPRKGMKNQNQQLKARQAVNQAKKKLQQKYTQQNQRNQRSQAFNQRRGLPRVQNAGIKQRLGVRKGQSQQKGRFNAGSKLRMDMVNRQAQTKKQMTPRRINRQNNQQMIPRPINRQNNQQRQITNQQINPTRKRKWGKTQQNVSSNPILQVSVPNKPTKSVSIQLSPNRQQNPQQRRLSNKVFQVQVAQERQQRKEGKQQPKRVIDNMLAQSQRQQQQLQNQVNQLQAVIANIQNTSRVKQNVNINRTDFANRNTGLSLNQRFSSSAPQAALTQIAPQTTFSRGGRGRGRGGGRRGRGGRGRGNRAPQQLHTTRQQLQSAGQRTVFL